MRGLFWFLVLFALAARDGLLDRSTADLLVIVVTLSMVAAPLLIGTADRLARRLKPAAKFRAFPSPAAPTARRRFCFVPPRPETGRS